MKYAIPLGGLAVIGLLALNAYLSQPVEVINEVEVIEEVHPDWATDQDAVDAAQAVIRRKELEAEETRLQGQIDALQSELDSVQLELGSYWRDVGNVKQLIKDTFPEAPHTALAIVACESGFKTDIQSHHILDYGREQSFGLFQIHAKVHHETAMRLGLYEYKTDPEQNAAMARHIYEAAGHSFTPWTCYSKNLIAMR